MTHLVDEQFIRICNVHFRAADNRARTEADDFDRQTGSHPPKTKDREVGE